MKKLTVSIVATSLLAGCVTSQPAQVRVERDDTLAELTVAARGAEAAQQQIAFSRNAIAATQASEYGVEVARNTAQATPDGWNVKATFEYEGPFNKLVERMAKDAGYRYFVNGSITASPAIVSVSANNEPLVNILRKVSAQLPDNVVVHVHQTTKSVVVTVKG